jgi:hypothetical protein
MLLLCAHVAQAQQTLTIAAFPAVDDIVRAAIPAWKRLHPTVDIKVVSRQFSDHHTAMTTAPAQPEAASGYAARNAVKAAREMVATANPHASRAGLAMVDSSKGITNLHAPNDVIVDARFLLLFLSHRDSLLFTIIFWWLAFQLLSAMRLFLFFVLVVFL